MKMKKKLLAVACASMFSASAFAGDFYINAGVDWPIDPDSNSKTESIRSLGLTGSLATSVYYDSTFTAPGSPPTGTLSTAKVFDSNTVAQLTPFGYAPGTYTAIDGVTSVTLHNPQAPGEVNIDNLNLVNGSVTDTEGFAALPNPPVLKQWGMEFRYALDGTLDISSPEAVKYSANYIDLFYTGNAGVPGVTVPQQILRLDVNGSVLSPANLEIKGLATFDFDGLGATDDTLALTAAKQAFVRNFFNDISTGKSFYDLWLAGNPIEFSFNTNVVPPIPFNSQLVKFIDPDTGLPTYIRQSTLNSEIIFKVPTPAPLALLGMGLLGFSAFRKARKI